MDLHNALNLKHAEQMRKEFQGSSEPMEPSENPLLLPEDPYNWSQTCRSEGLHPASPTCDTGSGTHSGVRTIGQDPGVASRGSLPANCPHLICK